MIGWQATFSNNLHFNSRIIFLTRRKMRSQFSSSQKNTDMKIKTLLFSLLLSTQCLFGQTVVDIIVGSPDHNVLEEAVVAAGLVDALNGDGPFTVFAPTDAAFGLIPDSVLTALLADPQGALTDILTYHVVADSLTTDSLSESIVTTLNGGTAILASIDGDLVVDNANIIVEDIIADNGVVHVIDLVIDPNRSTIADVVIESPDHTTLEAVLTSISGLATLTSDGPITLFAPTDEAFANLDPAILNAVLADEELLIEVLSRHVTLGSVLSTDLSNGLEVETGDGEIVEVFIDMNGDIFINNAKVTIADIERDNGVVHVVDAVILPAANTIADIVEDSDVHNILEIALDTAGLLDVLDDPNQELTVFAPTDDAFNLLPAGTIEALLADPSGLLTQILTNHVVPGVVLAEDIELGTQANTLEGSTLNFTVIDGGIVLVENAQIVITNLEADNGVVHVIDAVLDPRRTTVYDVIADSEVHNTLEVAVDTTGLNGPLSLDGEFTVFAPTDEAFAQISPEVLAVLLNDPQGALSIILLGHVVEGTALAADLSNGQVIETALGNNVNVTITPAGEVFIENAQVVVTDLPADNGVVHVIDVVLNPARTTVAGIIADSEVHNTLETAVGLAQLNGVLSTDGEFTVFAPTDEAFNNLPAGVLDAVLADSALLSNVLLYHVAGGRTLAGDLDRGQNITMLNGDSYIEFTDAGEVFIDNAQIILTDLEADNGVVHVIDAVLLPMRETVTDVVVNSEVHNTLETAITLAKLTGLLSGDGPFTVFAPTDDAFGNVDPATLQSLIDDPEGALTEVLFYHVVAGRVLSTDLSTGSVPTALGQNIDVVVDGGTVTVNGNTVVEADIEVDNGVVHVIDGVLVPGTTNTTELAFETIQVFPNPASDLITVQVDQDLDNSRYSILDITGKIVSQDVLNASTIDVSGLIQGVYTFVITSDQGNFISKFSKL